LIKLFEAETELLQKLKIDEAKVYTDGSTESEEENEESVKNDEAWLKNKQNIVDYV
jgi:hypothetical protein